MRTAAAVLAALIATAAGAWWFSSRPALAPPPPLPAPTAVPPRPPAPPPEPLEEEDFTDWVIAPRTVVLRGRVKDLNGAPVVGAQVKVTISNGTGFGALEEPESAAVTDGEGIFRLETTTGGNFARVRVTARGFTEGRYAESIRSPTDGAESAEIPIVLFPGGTLTGRVTDAGGTPVSGARVEVGCVEPPPEAPEPEQETSSGRQSPLARASFPLTASTLDDGTFSVDGIPLDMPLSVHAESGGWKRTEIETDLVLTPGMPLASLDLRFPAETVVRVRVLGSDGGPASTARVDVFAGASGNFDLSNADRGDSKDLVRPLDAPGEFEIRLPFTGRTQVSAWADDFLQEHRWIDVSEGVGQEIEFHLREGCAIEGTLVDDEGEPRFGVFVDVESAVGESDAGGNSRGPRGEGGPGRTYTNLEGRFRIDNLGPGPWLLRTRFGEDERVHRKIPIHAPDSEVHVVLSRWATARALLRLPPEERPPRRIRALVARTTSPGPVDLEWTDGTVEWQRLEKGEWTLEAEVEGYVPVQRTVKAFPGDDTDLGVILLVRGHPFEGRAVDGAGKPVADATVRLLEPSMILKGPIRTDADGRFAIPLLPAGKVRLTIAADPFAPALVTAVLPAPPATVVLRPGALVRGRLLLPEGVNPAESTIGVDRADDESFGGLAAADVQDDGSFETRLPAGRWRFRCIGWPDAGARSVEVDLPEGGSVDVVLDYRE